MILRSAVHPHVRSPCLDPLPRYECFVEGKSVYVKSSVPTNHVRKFAKQIDDDQRQFVVIGAGPAGVAACQSFREQGFTGKVVLITKEAVLPYDRTKMSKNMNMTAAEVPDRCCTLLIVSWSMMWRVIVCC